MHFQHNSSSSATLNRVVGDIDASQINGQITADGTVAIVNKNGVVFGQSAQVDVGSLIVSASDAGNDAFMQGNLSFDAPGTNEAEIRNNGTLSAREGGLVALVAPHVRNDGVISADAGRVALAGGNVATLDFYGDGLLTLAVHQDVSNVTAKNSGVVNAASGSVTMRTADAVQIVDAVVNMDGVIDTSSAVSTGGDVVLGGGMNAATITINGDGAAGTDSNFGIIMASSSSIDSSDGAIEINGQGGNGSADGNYGIVIEQGTIESDGSGMYAATITLDGTGGSGTADNHGIFIRNAASEIVSDEGNITLTGQGGDGSGINNTGIAIIDNAHIDSTNATSDAATITLIGTGGTTGSEDHGIWLEGDGYIDSARGAITLEGIATQADSDAVRIESSNAVRLDDGNLMLTGNALGATSEAVSFLENAFILADGTGNITIEATGAAVQAFYMEQNTTLGGGNATGDINIIASSISTDPASVIDTNGNVIISGDDNTDSIGLAGAAADIELSADELDNITADTLIIGRTDSTAALNVNSYSRASNMILRNGSGSTTLGGAVDLSGNTLNIVTSGDVLFNAALNNISGLQIDGGEQIVFNAAQNSGASHGDVTIDGATDGVTVNNIFRADSLNISNATGAVSFADLVVTGDVMLDTIGTISGNYSGVNGDLTARSSTINGTVNFDTLNLGSQTSVATLAAGNIGSSGSVNQAMANKITIDNVAFPNITANPSYTFEGFVIGFDPAAIPPANNVSPDNPSVPPAPPETPDMPEVDDNVDDNTDDVSSPPQAKTADNAEISRLVTEVKSRQRSYNDSEITAITQSTKTRRFNKPIVNATDDLLTALGCSEGVGVDACLTPGKSSR